MGVLKVSNLSFKYSVEDVLKKITLSVSSGQVVSILGPNGSGKTTLLKSMSHLLKPHEGTVLLKDKNIKAYGHKEFARHIAVVHQNQPTEFDFSVEEVVLMGRYPHIKEFQSEGVKDFEAARLAMQSTSTLALKDKNLKHISGGERQRVMIARALAQETDTLLLDEPISHLDIKYQLGILKMCQNLSRDKGMTVVTTLHDINMAARFSDVIVLMKQGEIVKVGSPAEVITRDAIHQVYEVDSIVSQSGAYPQVEFV